MNEKQLAHLLTAVLGNIGGPADLKALGVTQVQVVSPRTIRIDIAEGKSAMGVNRIKVTLQEDGSLRIRTAKYEEMEDVPNIAPANLVEVFKNIAGVEA
jgi:hypothetical protein